MPTMHCGEEAATHSAEELLMMVTTMLLSCVVVHCVGETLLIKAQSEYGSIHSTHARLNACA